jgi:colicin import membrane protein
MDAVSAHWRSRAAQQGWKTHPAVAIAAAPGAGSGSGLSGPITGAGPAGQPAGQLTQTGASLPIRSEKLGTAPPSADVKKAPTQAQPKNAPPTVQKDTPKDVSKK